MRTYSYIDKQKQSQSIEIPDWDLLSLIEKAESRYHVSKKYVDSYYTPIWRWAEKAYHLSMADRQAYIKSWQSNIAFGLIRSFIDVFVSSLNERPINFMVQGYNQAGIDNAAFIRHALATTADVTGFQTEIRHAMTEALKTGTFAFRIGMLPKERNHKVLDTTNPDAPKEVTFESGVTDFPYAKYVDVFNIYPDPHSWPLQYVTERYITTVEDAIETYSVLISSSNNESPLKDIAPLLTLNHTQADFTDYGAIRYQIPQKIADELRAEDVFLRDKNTSSAPIRTSGQTHDTDTSANDGKCEVKLYTDVHYQVLTLNGYPIYWGKNELGFIPYVIKATNTQNTKLGYEGMAFLLRWPANMMDSIMNNHIDSIKAVANPNFTYPKWAFLDESKIENLAPGEMIAIEAEYASQGIKRVDKGTVTDFWVFDLAMKIAQYISGASEYNLGGSTKERTATGALSATQSSQKRLTPFMSAFVEAVSMIAEMWIQLMRMEWTQEKYISVSWATPDELATMEALSNTKLTGAVGITLNLDSMISAIDELMSRNMLEIWNQMAGKGILNEKEWAKELARVRWLTNPKLIMDNAPEVTQGDVPPLSPTAFTPTSALEWQMIGQGISPQTNLGNQWLWQP